MAIIKRFPPGSGGPAVGLARVRRPVRPGNRRWNRHVGRLERVHEAELRIPWEVARDASHELHVTVDAVLQRFREHARTVARSWPGQIDPAVVVQAVTAADFQSAAQLMRERGVVAPSVVIERILLAAPGPAASGLRSRETVRRALGASPARPARSKAA